MAKAADALLDEEEAKVIIFPFYVFHILLICSYVELNVVISPIFTAKA